jgi:hypothetical protein
MRLFAGGAIALVALALAGCAFHASPTEGLQFRPPPGWRSSPGILGFMQFWRPQSGVREALMLFKSPKPLASSDVYSSANMQGAFKSVTVRRKQNIEICGNQPAYFVQGTAVSRNDTLSNVDMMLSTVHGVSYLAMYVRPMEEPPNAQAEAALHGLCLKS